MTPTLSTAPRIHNREYSAPDANRSASTRAAPLPYANVVIDRAHATTQAELTYAIPDELQGALQIGSAVQVPLAKQSVTGFIVGFCDTLDFDVKQLRAISGLAARAPIFDENALRLARWMSAYYHCPLSECLANCMPQGWQQATLRKYSYVGAQSQSMFGSAPAAQLARAPRQKQIAQILLDATRALSLKEIRKILGPRASENAINATLTALIAQGLVEESEELSKPELKPRRLRAVKLVDGFSLDETTQRKLEKSAGKQAVALRRLMQSDVSTPIPTAALARDFGIDASILKALEKKGWVEFTTFEEARVPTKELPPPDAARVQLTDEQKSAIATIAQMLRARTPTRASKAEPRTLLLQGVTASGKTEVYLHAIENCLQRGKRALVLVPEIALTAQTVEIFQRRFQERVAILHSALSAGERFDEWRKARAGRADIIVGARSAIFAPLRDLGLVIMDEEHDHSYKQDSMPRYHAREVALKRASLEGAVLVLGSATPSLESYQRVQKGDYARAILTRRVAGRALPEVEIVDMTEEAKAGALPVLSTRLQTALCEVVAKGEQAIVFLNRRGFATYVQCAGCGHVEKCPHCDVSLTFHRGARELRCHHCGHQKNVPEECPQCKGWMMSFSGTGTEKVESELNNLFSRRSLERTKILRLDRDTTSHKGAHAKILGEFRQGKAQVLVGTQMVTKGLDFPNVTLVGVISADTALNVPDFRAAERTFQLLAQVAGRAGRGAKPGRVLIQTLTTDHYAIEAARHQDFEKFVAQEMEFRKTPPYPPFSHVVNIISSDEELEKARARIEKLALSFHEAIEREGASAASTPGVENGCELLGPVECPLARVKNKFRFHLMLRDRNRPRLHRVLGAYDALPREAREGLTVDVDAMTIL